MFLKTPEPCGQNDDFDNRQIIIFEGQKKAPFGVFLAFTASILKGKLPFRKSNEQRPKMTNFGILGTLHKCKSAKLWPSLAKIGAQGHQSSGDRAIKWPFFGILFYADFLRKSAKTKEAKAVFKMGNNSSFVKGEAGPYGPAFGS